MKIRTASPFGWLSMLAMMFSLAMPLQGSAQEKKSEKKSESQEEAISLEQLPKRVREAVKLSTKGGDLEKAEKKSTDGKAVYEIEAEVEGGTVELIFNGDGQLIGIEVTEADEGDEDGEKAEGKDEEVGHDAEAGKKKGAQKSSAKEDDEGREEEHDDDEAGAEVSQNISIDKVPVAAREAISKRAGDAKLVGVEAITEAGATVYEAAWMKGDVKREVTVSKNGDVISEESSLSFKELPKAIQAKAKKFAGDSELKLERKSVVLYELEIVKSGKAVEVYVDASGREVSIELGDDDEEHASGKDNDDDKKKDKEDDDDDDKDDDEENK